MIMTGTRTQGSLMLNKALAIHLGPIPVRPREWNGTYTSRESEALYSSTRYHQTFAISTLQSYQVMQLLHVCGIQNV